MAALAFPIGDTGYTEAQAVQLVNLALRDTDVVASLSIGAAGDGTRCVKVTTNQTQVITTIAKVLGNLFGVPRVNVYSSDTAPGLVAADVTAVKTPAGWTDAQLTKLLAELPESAGLVTANENVFILTGVTPEQVNATHAVLKAASEGGYAASIDQSQYQGEEYASTSKRIIESFDAQGMRDIASDASAGAQLRRTDPLSGRSYDAIANPGNEQFGANVPALHARRAER